MTTKDSYYDVKFNENPSKYFKVSIKYINEKINGPGKNMIIFNRLCKYYTKGDIDNVKKIKQYIESSTLILPFKKKLMLIIFANFLININSLNITETIKLFSTTLAHIDTNIHIGHKIHDKLIEYKDLHIMNLKSDK